MGGQPQEISVSLGILSVIIVVSNCSVCALVCFNKTLRTYTNWLVLSLAVSDILTGGVLLPIVLIKPASLVTDYFITLILLSGVANACAVTCDRYVAIIKPLLYSYLAPKILQRALVVSWLISTAYTVLPLAWDTNPTKTIHIVYIVCLEIFGVVVPYIFVTFAYVQIFRQVRRSLTMRKDFESAREWRKERRRISSDAKAAKVFCIVSTAFLLSWLPILYSTTVYRVFNRPDLLPDVLVTISLFTVTTSSLVNPLIYAFLKPDFRVVIRNFCQKNSPTKVATKKPSIPSSPPRAKTEKKTKQEGQTVEKHESSSWSEYDTKL